MFLPGVEAAPSERQSVAGFGRVGTWIFAVVGILLTAALVVGLAGFGLAHYLRLDLRDDYEAGYAFGGQHGSRGVDDCMREMSARYLPWGGPTGNAFVAGCQDGALGRSAVSWYELRDRLPEPQRTQD